MTRGHALYRKLHSHSHCIKMHPLQKGIKFLIILTASVEPKRGGSTQLAFFLGSEGERKMCIVIAKCRNRDGVFGCFYERKKCNDQNYAHVHINNSQN